MEMFNKQELLTMALHLLWKRQNISEERIMQCWFEILRYFEKYTNWSVLTCASTNLEWNYGMWIQWPEQKEVIESNELILFVFETERPLAEWKATNILFIVRRKEFYTVPIEYGTTAQ